MEKFYRIVSFWPNRTRIWSTRINFHYWSNELHVVWFRCPSQYKFELAYKSYRKQSDSDFLKDNWFCDYAKGDGDKRNTKIITQTKYCPIERQLWFLDESGSDKLFNDLFLLVRDDCTITEQEGGLEKYIKLLAIFESLPNYEGIKVKRMPDKTKHTREELRQGLIDSQWRELSKWDKQAKQKLYEDIYGSPDITFKTIQKAIVRRQKRIAKQRQLSKREQNFFALMAGASNMNQLKKLIK